MRKTLLATVVGGLFLSLNVQAADLLQIYKEAVANDAAFASARASYAAGQEKITQGRSVLLPNVSASGTKGNSDQGLVSGASDLSGDFKVNNYSITLTQPLFRWAAWETYQQGKLGTAVAEAQFAQAQQDLIVRVAQAYFDVLASQDALASVQAQKTAITEQLAQAKRNFEVGVSTITDTHEAQARFDLVVAQEFAAQNDLDIKRNALQQIIGKPAGDLSPLRSGVKLSAPEPAQLDMWVSSAEKQNYNVAAAELAVEIAKRDISRNRAGHAPTLDLIAQKTRNYASGSLTSTNSSTQSNTLIGVQWSIPLFSGFGVDSKVREAIALEDKARADLENVRRNAAQGARQAFLGVNSGLAQVKALEAAEVSSQSALESNRLGYQVGVRINIDVLNAQQQLYSTRSNLSKARYETVVNGLRLKAAAGSLKESDLVAVNALLKQ